LNTAAHETFSAPRQPFSYDSAAHTERANRKSTFS
jgi:hypothetical protein